MESSSTKKRLIPLPRSNENRRQQSPRLSLPSPQLLRHLCFFLTPSHNFLYMIFMKHGVRYGIYGTFMYITGRRQRLGLLGNWTYLTDTTDERRALTSTPPPPLLQSLVIRNYFSSLNNYSKRNTKQNILTTNHLARVPHAALVKVRPENPRSLAVGCHFGEAVLRYSDSGILQPFSAWRSSSSGERGTARRPLSIPKRTLGVGLAIKPHEEGQRGKERPAKSKGSG